jgi:hypothetical protein
VLLFSAASETAVCRQSATLKPASTFERVAAVDAFRFFDHHVSSPVRLRADRKVNSAHRLFILGARRNFGALSLAASTP